MQQIICFKKPRLVETHYVFHLHVHKNDFPKILSVSIDFNPGYPVLSGQSVVRRLSVSVMDKNFWQIFFELVALLGMTVSSTQGHVDLTGEGGHKFWITL